VRSELKGAVGKKEQELQDPRSEGFALGPPGAQGPFTSYQQRNNSRCLGFQDASIAARGAALLATQFVWRDDHGARVCDAGQHVFFPTHHPWVL